MSPAVSRGFVAVVPPDDVLDAVEAVMGRVELPATVRRAARSKLHLTLRFLGNRVDFAEVEATLQSLTLRGGTTRLGGAGAFPRTRRGDVLWIGVSQGHDLLRELAASLEAALDPHRPTDERRSYHAHLTVARCKAPTDLRVAVDAIGAEPIGRAWDATDIVLMQSHLGRGPAEYEERARFRLES